MDHDARRLIAGVLWGAWFWQFVNYLNPHVRPHEFPREVKQGSIGSRHVLLKWAASGPFTVGELVCIPAGCAVSVNQLNTGATQFAPLPRGG